MAPPTDPVPARIRRVRKELHDTFTLELEPGIRFRPGQFTMVYRYGVGEVPISISGDPSEDVLVHTIRAVGPVTRAICALKKDDVLGIRGPYGAGWPLEEARGRDVVIVAGGVGIAPLRPAVYSILRERDRFGRVALFVGARTPKDLLFGKELEKWRGRFDLDVHVTVDSAKPGWRGDVGVVTRLLPRAAFDPASAVAILCGPEIMMRFAAQELRTRGMDAGRIFVSMERNMKCALGFCGHCQFGPTFVCKDGPVFPWSRVEGWLKIREL